MKITILYDNDSAKEGLETAWGFSAWIELSGKNILFDTGWDGGMLLYNMKLLGFNPRDIDVIFLSHQHWDHCGGLPRVLSESGNVQVYAPESFSKHMKNEIMSRCKLVEISSPGKIMDGLYSSGVLTSTILNGSIKEQGRMAVDLAH